jgi:hypothetical protein
MFADDSKMNEIIRQHGNNVKLQANITSFDLWSILWLMQFNLGKCHLLQIGRNPTPHNYTMMSAER